MKKLFLLVLLSWEVPLTLDAQSWSAVGNGISTYIYSIETFNNELYVGTMGYGDQSLYKWDNVNWTIVGSWINNNHYLRIHTIRQYNNELYISGYFDQVNNTLCSNIVRWDGVNWNTLGAGLDNTAYSMCVYNGEIYIAGQFHFAGNDTSNFIAKWNGSNWSRVGSGTNFNDGLGIFATCVYNNNLYVGGDFITVDSNAIFFIARWDGTSWTPVGSGLGFNTDVYTMAVYKGELYAGGAFTDILHVSSCNHLAKWDGSNWSCVGGGVNGISVNALTVYNGDLYVAGRFDSVGNIPANNIARWDGNQWYPLGSGLSNSANSLDTFQGGLYVGCSCSLAGGVPVQGIAKWEMPVSVNELTNSEVNIKVYMDPSNSFLIIEYNEPLYDLDVEITDVLGQMKYSQSHNKIFNGEKEWIDKSLLNKFNINFINITSKTGHFNKKIFIAE